MVSFRPSNYCVSTVPSPRWKHFLLIIVGFDVYVREKSFKWDVYWIHIPISDLVSGNIVLWSLLDLVISLPIYLIPCRYCVLVRWQFFFFLSFFLLNLFNNINSHVWLPMWPATLRYLNLFTVTSKEVQRTQTVSYLKNLDTQIWIETF